MSYNNNVIDAFFHSKYLGELKKNWDKSLNYRHGHHGVGDVVEIELGLDSRGTVRECAFKAYGNPYLFAAMDRVCQLLDGESANTMPHFNRDDVINQYDVPREKWHSVLLAEDVYDAVIEKLKESRSYE